MSYPTVEITTPALPEVLPTDHQDLMNLFYNHWQALSAEVTAHNDAQTDRSGAAFMRDPNQGEIASVFPTKVNMAVILGNHHYQVGNGGWMQWDDNGYSASVDALYNLYEAAEKAGIEDAGKVVDMINEFRVIKSDEQSYRDNCSAEEEVDHEFQGSPYDNLDTRYYAIDGQKLMQEMLDQFDTLIGNVMLAGAYRKAA